MSLSDEEEDFLSADEDVDESRPTGPIQELLTKEAAGSSLPPAPPPTPALSSSPSSGGVASSPTLESATAIVEAAAAAVAVVEPIKNTSSQYSWRIPPAGSPKAAPISSRQAPPSRTESPESGDTKEAADKAQQAKLALDKLSERLSHQEKSFFELVAGDIKKVAIRAGETLAPPGQEQSTASGEPTTSDDSLPNTLVDLGTSIGSWGWSNASKLLTSATKVTTQVTSQVSSQVNAILTPISDEVKKDNK